MPAYRATVIETTFQALQKIFHPDWHKGSSAQMRRAADMIWDCLRKHWDYMVVYQRARMHERVDAPDNAHAQIMARLAPKSAVGKLLRIAQQDLGTADPNISPNTYVAAKVISETARTGGWAPKTIGKDGHLQKSVPAPGGSPPAVRLSWFANNSSWGYKANFNVWENMAEEEALMDDGGVYNALTQETKYQFAPAMDHYGRHKGMFWNPQEQGWTRFTPNVVHGPTRM